MTEGMPHEAPDLTVIVVTYNSRADIEAALESADQAAAAAGLRAELIVVDNDSTDGTADLVAERRPAVRLVRNAQNVGFGSATNQAFELATGRHWLLLNPDARLGPGTLPALIAALDGHSRLAAVGPAIRGAGTGAAESAGMLPDIRSLAGHFLFLNRLLPDERGGRWRGWQLQARARPALRHVEWLSGAVLLAQPAALREVGGFDPSIFLYGEDTDLGERLGRAGWDLAVVTGARAEHAIGGSQRPESVRWIEGLDDYLGRSGRSGPARRTCMAIIAVGLAARAIVGSATGWLHRSTDARRLRAGAREAARRALARPGGTARA